MTAGGGEIVSPYGGSPGYVSLMLSDFTRASEEAWLIGLSYDFRDFGWDGLTGYLNYTRGTGARDAGNGGSLPDVDEVDLTLDYRFQQGRLQGLWLRVRAAFSNDQIGSSRADNIRLIINYEFSLL